MAKLTKNQTAAAILAHLQTPHAVHAPVISKALPVQPAPRLHPWFCRYDATAAAVLIYLPSDSVAGQTLDRSGLTAHDTLPDFFLVPHITGTSSGSFPSWKVVVSLAAGADGIVPTFYTSEADIPDGAIVVAETTSDGSARPVRQYVVGALTLGSEFFIPGPIGFYTESDGSVYLGQLWWKWTGSDFELPENGIEYGDPTPRPGDPNRLGGKYAARILMYPHADDHTDGVVTVRTEL